MKKTEPVVNEISSSSTAFGLAARSSGTRVNRASGFTLIEVMVVIVILEPIQY